ncbi:Cystathionine gamma-lyase [Candidatus Hydrogenisulfobacillus filiaventi]|uniref:homocysteine desulfhydrase n=1 Tax=Candidatus Hydrogenisulfobacillus filiaventi TaxID=2707344 RepID=A0A6F8ZEF1_9FIRM|nr:PLP-dependent transferase [Bacillota bacterium]CAB1128248.1 Cystathionine gamma-lyase [Candidatus Hydrogenisulfobacillus filiaventi]
MGERENPGPVTRFVHPGPEMDPVTGALAVPVYRAASYHQPDPWAPGPYDYGRSGNPTRQALEEAIAALEHGVGGFAFASGMAAITAALLLFGAGDHLLVTRDCQGGTQRLLRGVFARWGLRVTYVDTDRLEEVAAAREPATRAVYVENFSNPFLRVTDLPALAEWAHREGLLVLVDNTFITPALQQPLDLGADLVLHSASKLIGGHADVTAGLAVTADPALARRLYFIQNATGGVLGPDDAFAVLRGLRTLPLRMERAAANARRLAAWLAERPEVRAVYYPGLASDPGHATAARTLRGFGQMVTIRLASGEAVMAAARAFRLVRVGAGFGGLETSVSLPELHCHAALTSEERAERAITPDVLRISVGLEDPEDLLADFAAALEAAAGAS